MGDGTGIVDGYSGATILGQAASGSSNFVNGLGESYSTMDMFLGTIPGSIGETSTLAILLGALILILTGVGSWKVIVSVFAGGTVMGLLLNAFAVNEFMALPFYFHGHAGFNDPVNDFSMKIFFSKCNYASTDRQGVALVPA